ncbi:MAG TPA: homoserine O-acetyltransferase [Pseudolabrys sp.]|nr:homoserine O-acetyltransferase [Pseudolabrys sp.]
MIRRAFFVLALLVLAGVSQPRAHAADLIVEKKTFALPSYTTVGGAPIKNMRIGWEAAGTLNADKSNAILITHFFSGTSHAFGKYAASDATAGYWDGLIGPSKLIDTDKYYVISSDTLVNLNVKAPNVVTTGPASIDPDTGKPYGMRFPVVSIRDFVRVQKALIDSLGIKKLKAVMGASMGGLQAYEWAASYPEAVERIIPIIASPGGDAFLIGWLDAWGQPIRIDPKWNGGDYYDKEPPLDGLKASLTLITLQAQQWEWAAKAFGTAPAEAGKDPGKAFGNRFKIEVALDAAATARAKTSDANSLLYLVKANQLADADRSKIKVPVLAIYTPTDLIFYPPSIETAAKAMAATGTPVETAQLTGPNGHLNGVLAVGQAADKIKAFLER